MNKGKRLILFALAAVLLLGVIVTPMVVSAENVVIEKSAENEVLEHANIGSEGGKNSEGGDVWPAKGELTQDGGDYTLTSNGFAQWYDFDGLGFAYKKVYFNYGKKAVLSFEGRLNSFDGNTLNAGAGLMIRSSLKPSASTTMMHIRPGHIMATYRAANGGTSTTAKPYIQTSADAIKGMYPFDFKIELQKTTVTYYYKTNNASTWTKGGSVPFEFDDNENGYVYIGISVYSQLESFTCTSTWSDFYYQVEAPEGTEPGPGDGGGGAAPTEPPVVLPPDLPIASDDVLLRETFTDGSMVDANNPEGKETPDNPIWRLYGSGYEIAENDDQTNRYMALEFADPNTAFYAGSRDWTDYRFQMDVTFTDTTAITEKNALHLYVRHTDYPNYGYENYTVSLTSYNKRVDGRDVPTNCILLASRTGGSAYYGAGHVALVRVDLDYLADLGTTHTIAVEAFDNTITVYWDGEEMLTYTDNGDDSKDYLAGDSGIGYEIKSTGRVGFNAEGACVNIDNIFVYKLDDPLGGDYDNEIGGNWDSPRPDDFLGEFTELPY